MIYVQQNGSLGKSIPYPSSAHPKATIATSGCGVCASLMVLLNSTNYKIELKQWKDKVVACGGRVAEGTDMAKVASMMTSNYGFSVEWTRDINKLKEHLKKGYKAVLHVGQKGYFSSSGHFVCAYSIKNGKAIILDPYYYSGKWKQKVNGIDRAKHFTYDSSNHAVYCEFSVIQKDRRSSGYYWLFTPTAKIDKESTSPYKLGIDTSKHNHASPKAVNYSKVTADFAIPRAGYRGWGDGNLVTDPYFKADIEAASKNNIPVGVYWFAQEITTAEAVKAADYVCELVKGYKLSIPIYYDSEKSTAPTGKKGRADKLSKAARTDISVAFCERVIKNGYRAGVYASESWFKNKLDFERIKKYSIWCAKYGAVDNGKPHTKPNLSKVDIWQYTSKGTAPGVTGNVDLNYMLNNVIDGATPTPTPTPSITYFKKYTGKSNSIVDALNAIGADSSYAYRKKIATANGIKNYSGTAAQNTKMLALLKKGVLMKP